MHTLSIIAPSGPFKKKAFEVGIKNLKKFFKVSYSKNIFSRNPKLSYLAGSDERRAHELITALKNSSVDAILMARGGYGCQRLIPYLEKETLPSKPLIGLSDPTFLLGYFWKKYRTPSIYGPMVAPHGGLLQNIRRIQAALTDPEYFSKQPLRASHVLNPGKATGRLVGGCLALVVASLGTPWEIDTNNAILFLEDTHEEPYAVDRMLTHLEQAGKLKNLRGIVLGTFRLKKNHFPKNIRKVFEEKLKKFKGPVLWGLRFGHCPDPRLIPYGGIGKIQKKTLSFSQGIF